MPNKLKVLFTAILIVLHIGQSFAQEAHITDASHYSNVFGEMRHYRVFLPSDYWEQPQKRYPVIYFYHGWSQRYFGSIESKTDESDEEKIARMVAKYDIIVVKPDGYNKRPNEPYYLRPYNIGPVEGYRQFPLYFPELVDHIDAQYRTNAHRKSRGITGYSMGGFMSFWIAGKYPHLVSAAGSFCGSAEFFVGPVDYPVEYFHGDMYGNYEGLKLRLHYGEEDFIRAYHKDIDAIWKQVLDNYESRVFPGKHDLSGLEEMFQFFDDAFQQPLDQPERWNHIDVYPDFQVWDYTVSSDRSLPGFTVMEDVDIDGFKIGLMRKLPDGESLPMVSLSVTTAPIYVPNDTYTITFFENETGNRHLEEVVSDDQGRLQIHLSGAMQEVGIHRSGGRANLTIAGLEILSAPYLSTQIDLPVRIGLLNKGGTKAKGIKASLRAVGQTANVKSKEIEIGDLDVLDTILTAPFTVYVNADSVKVQKFLLTLKDEKGQEWNRSFVLPFRPKREALSSFEIADGREVTFQQGGKDTVTMVLGKGNGDGLANPGEKIVVLIKHKGLNRLSSLSSLHPQVDLKSAYTRVSDSWTQFDHVGGSFKYSAPVLSSDIASGSEITFYAEYWLPEYPDHHIKGGVVSIPVAGDDRTAPQLDWARVSQGNIFQAQIYDGGQISDVSILLRIEKDPHKPLDFSLLDNGKLGDKKAGDGIYSRKIEVPEFGPYEAEITVSDIFGNQARYLLPQQLMFHEVKLFPEGGTFSND